MSKDFLQSEEWRKFQEAAGRRTFLVGEVSIIEHILPVVGKYFYIPRGNVANNAEEITDLAKKEKAGWIRFDANSKEALTSLRPWMSKYKIIKSPHNVQPREIFVIDITKSEEELLAEMKPKTRYNIKLSQKHGVSAKVISNPKLQISNQIQNSNDKNSEYYLNEFLKLVKITAKRDGITPHPENYYRRMFETIPGDILKLYVAECKNKIIAANLVVFYGNTATYLHGASDNEHRNVMAPYLLQWRQVQNAKKAGYARYDFGGVSSDLTPALSLPRRGRKGKVNSWTGITKFKTGFSPATKPIEFLGSYDIIISPIRYNLYRLLQRAKSFL